MGLPRSFNSAVSDSITVSNLSVGVNGGKIPSTGVVNAHIKAAAGIKGSKIATRGRTLHAKAMAKLDLSGAAQSDIFIFRPDVACTLTNITFLYVTEASSADAGVLVTVGNHTNHARFASATSTPSKTEWDEESKTIINAGVAAGESVLCYNAGGKDGAGEILVCIEYVEND